MDVAITIAKDPMGSQKFTVVAQNVIMDAHISAINGACVQATLIKNMIQIIQNVSYLFNVKIL